MSSEYYDYFVWMDSTRSAKQFRVARREVKTRTRKGYPITYVLKCYPNEYETWEEAQATANRLKEGLGQAEFGSWVELEENGFS